MITTLKALRSLTREQRAVLNAQKVTGLHKPRWLIDTLGKLAEFDHLSDKARTRLGMWIALCVAATIVSLILVGNGLRIGLVVPLVAIPLAIYFIVTLIRLSRLDLSNNFRVVALPFFAILDQDMASDAAIDLNLDLSSATAKAKKTATGKPYERGAYYKVVDTTYADPWFSGSAKLADGSVLNWSIVDEVIKSSRTKRGRRGKIKTKSATRRLSTISVGVGLPIDTYEIGTGPIADGDKFKLVEGEKRNTIKLARKIKTKSEEPMAARELIDIVGEAYLRAKPVRSAA